MEAEAPAERAAMKQTKERRRDIVTEYINEKGGAKTASRVAFYTIDFGWRWGTVAHSHHNHNGRV